MQKKVKNISNMLLKIQNEVVKSRRQHIFKTAYEGKFKEDLRLLVSISLLFTPQVSITPKVSASTTYPEFGEVFGIVYYHYILKNYTAMKKYVRSLPKDYQIIVGFVVSGKFLTLLWSDFLFETVSDIIPQQELLAIYLEEPDIEDTPEIIKFDTGKSAEYPLVIKNIRSMFSKNKKLYYYLKTGEDVRTNITVQKILKYLKNTFANDFSAGIVLKYAISEARANEWHILPIIKGSSEEVENAMAGKCDDITKLYCKYNCMPKSVNVKSHHSKTYLINNEYDLKSFGAGFTKNTILFAKGLGVKIIGVETKSDIYRIADYMFDDEYNPIGLIIDYDGELVGVKAKITQKFLQSGIKDRFVRVTSSFYNGILIKLVANTNSNTEYKQCKVCGKITSTRNGMCWRCKKMLFRVSVENGSKTHFTYFAPNSEMDYTFSVYKYTAKVGDNGFIHFEECPECWNKQGILPYDWWED